jgi:serine/threonine protein kinase
MGTMVGDFEVIGLVGEGGFGIVYLARDTTLDRVVALKEFMPAAFAGRVDGIGVAVRAANHLATYEAGLRSFINEAKLLAKFAHPALVEVYRFWEGNGTAYMAMRYYSGETLRQRLSKGDTAFDEEFIAQTMAPIFDALEVLHREKIYHRDIAPDNIMLSDGRPVLLDFGSARRIIGDGTQALTTILKPGYAPIEQYVDDGTMKQGPWTDVYALGGVLYHLATGKAPMQAVSRLLSDPLRPVNEVTNDAFSLAFSDAVAKAMAVRVEDRLQNVKAFSEMLGWNTVQSTRVVTLPGGSRVRPEAARVALSSPDSTDQNTIGPVKNQVNAAALAGLVAGSPVSRPATVPEKVFARVEKPADQLQTQAPSLRTSIFIAAASLVAVLGVAVYWYLGHSDSSTPSAPLASARPDPAMPAKELVASAQRPAEPASVESPPVVLRTGKVLLNITPWGAVVVDGVTRGISNSSQLRQIELPVGTHTIEIAKPDAKPLMQTIEVTDNVLLSISHAFK